MRSDVADAYDLIVIGTGSGGSGPANRCRQAGWRVAVIDDEPYGGTCALRGCDPKKVLVGAAELADWQRRMSGHGLNGDVRIDWPALMKFKRTFTEPVPQDREAAFQRAGIDTYHGLARFTGPDRLTVEGHQLRAKHFVIASGARPRKLDIPGQEHVRTSTEFLDLDTLPRRIALIGAGYIGFEFAHIARRAGAEVAMLGRGSPLREFEPELVARLVEHTRNLGVEIKLDSPVAKVERVDGEFRVHLRGAEGNEVLATDLVVHAAGRVPKTGELQLQNANVSVDERGAIVVNDALQSVTNPIVYAAGDAVSSPGAFPLTPVAAHQGLVVASNLLHGNNKQPDYRGIPSIVFTTPPLARVGLSEESARHQGLKVHVKSEDTRNWFSNRRVAETSAMFKTITEETTDRVLGAHLLGPHADEIINLFAVAIRHELKAADLAHMIYGYPTSGSDVPYML